MITKQELQELKVKHEAATPGPWTATQMGGLWVGTPHVDTPGRTTGGKGELFAIEPEASPIINRFGLGEEERCEEQARADEHAIAELHNAFPDLYALAKFAIEAKAFLDAHGERIHDAFVHSGEDHDAWSNRLHATDRIIAEARALGAKP